MAEILQSDTRIANRALILLGTATRVISVDDPLPLGRQIKDIWFESRRAAIVSHPWNFALFRKLLNASGSAPAFGYAYQYKLPAEALRWLPPERGDDDFFEGEEEGGSILSNAPAPLSFRGIQDVEDVAQWSAGFVYFMAYQLAADLAASATQFKDMAQEMANERENALREAKRIDGQSSGSALSERRPHTSRWVTARFSRLQPYPYRTC
jgi:hypothetical protein